MALEIESPEWQPLIGLLSFMVAILSVGIVEVLGEWPTDIGIWGAFLFVLFGIILIWDSMTTPTE